MMKDWLMKVRFFAGYLIVGFLKHKQQAYFQVLFDDEQDSGSFPPRNWARALLSVASPSLVLPAHGGMLMCCEYPSCGEPQFRGM